MQTAIDLLILTGPVGVGKTQTARAISGLLTENGLSNAVIDMDCLRWAYPRPRKDPFHIGLGFENLTSIWPNYRDVGVNHLVMPTVIEDRSALAAFKNAVPNSVISVVQLSASLETIHQRLERREVGESLARHQRRAIELVDQFNASDIARNNVNTEGKPIAQVAKEVLALWLWDIKG